MCECGVRLCRVCASCSIGSRGRCSLGLRRERKPRMLSAFRSELCCCSSGGEPVPRFGPSKLRRPPVISGHLQEDIAHVPGGVPVSGKFCSSSATSWLLVSSRRAAPRLMFHSVISASRHQRRRLASPRSTDSLSHRPTGEGHSTKSNRDDFTNRGRILSVKIGPLE